MTLSWQQVLSHKYQYSTIALKYRLSTSNSTQYKKTGKYMAESEKLPPNLGALKQHMLRARV